MKKWIIAAALVAVSIWYFHSRTNPSRTAMIEPVISEKSASSPSPVTGPTPRKSGPAEVEVPRQTPELSVVGAIPESAKLRAEVARDPHAAPTSGILFAQSIGKKLKKVRDSEEESSEFFNELEDCVTIADPAKKNVAVQAICLKAAKDLAKKNPSLLNRYDVLLKKAEPQVSALLGTSK